ncbi:Ig-like domain-containing protein [Rhodococcus marinonascens]|uniref:Ig-like domain-containing protein n=1 Tax=Rhodococcus marinonascens TaxID=38311 RepID=UPI000933F29B|nr:Ig-like domain-containing protein [Rhodococcus marinonascens]
MSGMNIRRMISALGVVAVTVGFTLAAVDVASAAPATLSWKDGKTKFTRTISNVNPRVNERVTTSTKIERTGGVVEYIREVTDITPTCWSLVSAKVDEEPYSAGDTAGAAQVKGGPTQWPIRGLVSRNSRTFEFTYRITDSCSRTVPVDTGVTYDGTLGKGNYKTKGPEVTVVKDPTTTEFGDVPTGMQVGQSVPLTANVTNGAQQIVSGDVEFYDGTTKIGEAPVRKGSQYWKGTAALDWTPSTEGTHSLSAVYVETSKVARSESSKRTVQISSVPDAETRTVVTGPATAQTGTEVSFEAQVSPAPEGGIVQFRDGDTDLGIPVPVGENGRVSITRTFDSEGAHDITAVYSGAPGYSGSTAQPITVTVTVNDEGGGADDGGNTDGGGTGSAGNIFGF